ncbi:hypothetical protein, partial [Pseudomonas chlororaphis]
VPVLAGNTKDEGTLFAKLFGKTSGSGISGYKPNDYDRFGMQYTFAGSALYLWQLRRERLLLCIRQCEQGGA